MTRIELLTDKNIPYGEKAGIKHWMTLPDAPEVK